MIAASSSSRGMAAMNARKSSTENGMQERDLDQDQAEQRLEQPDPLQHLDRRHDRGRDDEPGEHQGLTSAATRSRPALQHEADHRREHTISVTEATVRMMLLRIRRDQQD